MTNLICTQIISFQRDLNWNLSNIIEMYWFIDTIVTTTFCHEFVRNISAKIGCNPFCYYLMVLNWHCIYTIENIKKTYINLIPCSARTISFFLSNHHLLWRNIYALWVSSSSVCDGEHFFLKIHKLLLLFDIVFRKYASCNHPLKNIQTWVTL